MTETAEQVHEVESDNKENMTADYTQEDDTDTVPRSDAEVEDNVSDRDEPEGSQHLDHIEADYLHQFLHTMHLVSQHIAGQI